KEQLVSSFFNYDLFLIFGSCFLGFRRRAGGRTGPSLPAVEFLCLRLCIFRFLFFIAPVFLDAPRRQFAPPGLDHSRRAWKKLDDIRSLSSSPPSLPRSPNESRRILELGRGDAKHCDIRIGPLIVMMMMMLLSSLLLLLLLLSCFCPSCGTEQRYSIEDLEP